MIRCLLSTLLATILLFGCAKNMSSQSYSVGSVRQINRTISGNITSVREVDITGTTGTGGGAGSVLGAIGGSSIGGTSRDNLAGAIGGAVIGGLIGSALEKNTTKQQGLEYMVETENGNLMTIVQGLIPLFGVRQKVLVLYGSPSRVIIDPRNSK
jgi:outer membrane lipoprotein SlyB